MQIQITKRPDGVGVLRCVRADGSISWQKIPKHGAHFALHDLTHYAVETTLGAKRACGPLPPEAVEVEQIVGLFDSERASGAIWTLDEFREFGGAAGSKLTPEQIAAIRARRSELFQQWSAVPPGGVLTLYL